MRCARCRGHRSRSCRIVPYRAVSRDPRRRHAPSAHRPSIRRTTRRTR
jgi:hypothetical protein